METYIGIPCYKVAKSIQGVLNRLAAVRKDLHIILVNDGSPDNLDEVIAFLGATPFLSFHYHKHPHNRGYGGAQKTIFSIFKSLAKNKNDLLILVHGDGQTSEEEVARFIDEAGKSPIPDAVLGSRMLNSFWTQKKSGRPVYKIIADYILTFIQNRIYNLRLSTYASGFRCFTKKGIDKIDFSGTSDKHVFDTEALILFRFFNVKYREIPVKVVRNDTGASANNLASYAKNTVELAMKYSFRWRKKALRFLIINSDDYGLSLSVNKGISEAFASNAITSASILANGQYFNDAIVKAKAGGYSDRIGVHINVTEGAPLGGNYRTIADKEGNFLGISKFILKSFFGKLDRNEITKEVDLQVKKILDSGVKPSHLDTHQWSQIVPEVSRAMIEAAEKHRIPCLRRVNETHFLGLLLGSSIRGLFNSMVVSVFKNRNAGEFGFSNLVSQLNLRLPDYFAGIMLSGHSFYRWALKYILNHLKPGTTELMCHIASDGSAEDLKSKSYYAKERYREFKVLSSSEIRETIASRNIKLISYRDFTEF